MAISPVQQQILDQMAAGDLTGLDPGKIKEFINSLGLTQLDPSGEVPYGDLADKLNKFMTGQVKAPFVANLPGYEGMWNQAAGNAASQLRGEIPQDVINQMLQRKGERDIVSGLPPGAPVSNARYMKEVYDTSANQQKIGMENLRSLIADTPIPQIFNPASIFVPEYQSILELIAALAGRQTGTGGGGGGVTTPPGTNTVTLPGGSLNDTPLGPGSWQRGGGPTVTGPANDWRSTTSWRPSWETGALAKEKLYNSVSDPWAINRNVMDRNTFFGGRQSIPIDAIFSGGQANYVGGNYDQFMQNDPMDFSSYLNDFGLSYDTRPFTGDFTTPSDNLGPSYDFYRTTQPSISAEDIFSGGIPDYTMSNYDRFFTGGGGGGSLGGSFYPGDLWSGGVPTSGPTLDDLLYFGI